MLKSFSWVVVANLARQASFLIVNAILYERLSRSTFGAIVLAFSYMVVFAGLGEFGIRQIAWREIARAPERIRQLTGPLLAAKSMVSTLALIFYLAMMPLLWKEELPPLIYVLYGAGIFLNGSTFDFPLFGMNRVDILAKLSLWAFGIYLLACLLFVRSDEVAWLVPFLFAVSMGILLALQLVWFWTHHGKFTFRVSTARFTSIVREAWPLGVGETLNRMALSYPVVLIGMTFGSESVANYKIAELGYSFLAQFGHMYAAAGFSRVSYAYENHRKALPATLLRMLGVTSAAAVIAGALFVWLGPLTLKVVFDDIAEETVRVVQILGVSLIFAATVRLIKGLLAGIDRQQAHPLVSGVGLIIGSGVGWLAMTVLDFGAAGMAIGVVIAEASMLGLLLGVIVRDLRP